MQNSVKVQPVCCVLQTIGSKMSGGKKSIGLDLKFHITGRVKLDQGTGWTHFVKLQSVQRL